jgi:23S rRNA (cytosine1962-C5)-methyltransferase
LAAPCLSLAACCLPLPYTSCLPAKDQSALVTHRAAARLRSGHVWVYRSDLAQDPKAPPGSLIDVLDERGRPLGAALYSSSSQIALRLLTRQTTSALPPLPELIRERLDAALVYRKRIVKDSNAYRVVFSEGDALPGLIVDRYNDVVTFQIVTQAFDQPQIHEAVIAWIAEKLSPVSIVERVDARIRQLESLPEREGGIVFSREGETPRSRTEFTMNDLRFVYDAVAGQKTGAFLDQRENYAAAERYAHGEALDVFSYQGGFALHLARACEQVTAVDSSRPALEVAEQNEKLNAGKLRPKEIEWIEANAFDLLKDYATAGRQYDTIVLDPPAFAKSAKNLETALRGYKELNLRALRMLRPDGVLITCSCSYHVSEPEFVAMLASAAADVHRTVRIVERRGAALDHPAVLGIPETAYLKCVICTVS